MCIHMQAHMQACKTSVLRTIMGGGGDDEKEREDRENC